MQDAGASGRHAPTQLNRARIPQARLWVHTPYVDTCCSSAPSAQRPISSAWPCTNAGAGRQCSDCGLNAQHSRAMHTDAVFEGVGTLTVSRSRSRRGRNEPVEGCLRWCRGAHSHAQQVTEPATDSTANEGCQSQQLTNILARRAMHMRQSARMRSGERQSSRAHTLVARFFLLKEVSQVKYKA
jgi:hypothetical protein